MSRYFEKDHLPTWSEVSAYSGRWQLYKDLIGGIPADIRVKSAALGLHMAYVESDVGVGVSMLVRGGAGMPRLSVDAAALSLRDLAALSTSWNFCEATVGVAALNAWYSSEGVSRGSGVIVEGADNDAFRTYAGLIAGKRVCVVGHFPLIERLGDICELTVLERVPQQGDIPDPACEYIMDEQDFLFSTGITLQNKTLPRLLELARQGGVRVVLVGPSVVPAPALHDHGVDCMAGSIVLPEHAEGVKRAIVQGSRMNIFGNGLSKTRLESPAWKSLVLSAG